MSLASELAVDRRRFVLAGATLAAIPWLSRFATGAIEQNPRFSADPFPLGVACGDPSPDGAVIWTRLAPAPLSGGGLPANSTYEVTWEVANDDSMRSVVLKGSTLATPQLGHSIHVEVTGLASDRWYWYRFRCGDASSRIGRLRTAPTDETLPSKLRFAFASCQHYEQGLFTAYQHMAREDLDLVVHLGDYIYEYAGKENLVRKHEGPEITTLEHYRNRYAQYRLDPHLQAAHALCPWLVVWDDHEFDNNCAGDISEEPHVLRDDYLLRRANAYQAFYEHMPLRRTSLPLGPDMQIYRTVRFGRLANFEMLDTRQYRSDQPNGDGNKPLIGAVFDPRATLLGPGQEQWLMSELLKSPSQWNVLAQQIMMGRADRMPGKDARFSMDQWSGYDVARKRLLHFLGERRVPNPVVLTGDIHSNWVNDLLVDFDNPRDPVVGTEFVGSSISSGGNGAREPKDMATMLAENPFVHFYNTERGYVSCTVTTDTWKSDYQIVPYVDRPDAPLITRSSFVIENGKAGAQTA